MPDLWYEIDFQTAGCYPSHTSLKLKKGHGGLVTKSKNFEICFKFSEYNSYYISIKFIDKAHQEDQLDQNIKKPNSSSTVSDLAAHKVRKLCRNKIQKNWEITFEAYIFCESRQIFFQKFRVLNFKNSIFKKFCCRVKICVSNFNLKSSLFSFVHDKK